MFVEPCKETSLGCILNYTDTKGKKKRAFISRADQRQILSFGTYFKQVFDNSRELNMWQNISSFKIPTGNSYIPHVLNKTLVEKLENSNSSKELCDIWMQRQNHVDVHKTTGVPAVQLCRNTVIQGFGPCDLPNAELAMHIYIMRREIDECDANTSNCGTLLYKRNQEIKKKDWKFHDNFATTNFIWTSNEANEVMNIGVAKGRFGMMIKYWRGLVIPVIELD